MSQINVTIPDDILEALQMTPATFGNEVLLAAAVKLYEIGRLSSGAAA